MQTAQDLPDGASITVAQPWRLLGWLTLGAVVLLALLIALPHSPYIRFQALNQTLHQRVQWSYERIAFDPTPIDIAIVGNSRMEAGVDAPALSAALAAQLGRPVRVVNLATSQEGRNMHWVMVDQLLTHHPEVSLILMSVIEQAPRRSHPAFHNLATTGDILTAPIVLNQDWPTDLAYLPFRQLDLAIRSLAPAAFGLRAAFDPATYAGPDYDTTVTFTLPDGRVIDRDTVPPEPDLRAAATERLRGISPPLLPARFGNYEFVIERHYTARIAARAKAQGVGVGFIYLPIYTNDAKIADQEFYTGVGPILNGQFIAEKPGYYSDYGHLNNTGAQTIVPWLADQIKAAMTAQAITLKSPG